MYIINENDTVYFALPAQLLTLNVSADARVAAVPENFAIWKAPNDDDILVMASHLSPAVDQIRYDPEIISGELTFDRIITDISPKLNRVLARFGNLRKNGDFTCAFAFAQKGKAFILSLGYCEEVTDFGAAGYNTSGYIYYEELAMATLRLTQGKPPMERFGILKRILDENAMGSDTRLIVADTKTFTPYLINRIE